MERIMGSGMEGVGAKRRAHTPPKMESSEVPSKSA